MLLKRHLNIDHKTIKKKKDIMSKDNKNINNLI